MREDHFRSLVAGLSPADYVAAARAHGRLAFPRDLQLKAVDLYDATGPFIADDAGITEPLRSTIDLVNRVTYSDAFLLRHDKPRYAAYANISVLYWAVGVTSRSTTDVLVSKTRDAISILLKDALQYELNTIAGVETRGPRNIIRERLEIRVKLLDALFDDLWESSTLPIAGNKPSRNWDVMASTPAEALVHLTAFPLTEEHDEYFFLRSIHISECVFRGVLACAITARQELLASNAKTACAYLNTALQFARILKGLFGAFAQTLPPENFRAFRDATGDASAIQSRSYQLMQLHLLGMNPEKLSHIARNPELADIAKAAHPDLLTLQSVTLDLKNRNSTMYAEIEGHVLALDDALYAWRTIHHGIAAKYLDDIPVGTGATAGPAYLKKDKNKRILDTPFNVPEIPISRELWDVEALIFVRPVVGRQSIATWSE